MLLPAELSKTAVVLVRLGGFLAALVYTSVGRYWFPDRRAIGRGLDCYPGFAAGWGEQAST
jgi:hypothetical protein